MAEISPTRNQAINGWIIETWATVTESDTFEEVITTSPHRDVIARLSGTFGGATVVLQGSIDGTNWQTVKDIGGDDISFTAAGFAEVRSIWPYMRFSASSGASQSVTAELARASFG